MDIYSFLSDAASQAVSAIFETTVPPEQILVQPTRRDFSGHYTIVCFPFAGILRKSPQEIGELLGKYLTEQEEIITSFEVVKGFLNLTLTNAFWTGFLQRMTTETEWWKDAPKGEKVLVEFASPNTNKPLHLGHVRNILLGWSMSRILEASGYEVIKVQIINDRGIAICKSMLAWQKFGDGATPESTGMKPDHFVGHWYVQFEKLFKEEYAAWQESEDGGLKVYEEMGKDENAEAFFRSYRNTYFNEHSILGREAREMLVRWEQEDAEVRALWKKMNDWVYEGFASTYARLGVSFDKLYYESDTYLLGRGMVEQGVSEGVFYRKDDGSVWVDLTEAGLDQKILLRSDGTSVYITQDIGTAQLRYEDFGARHMVYVVADEQDYHFRALIETLKLLKVPYADGLYHLSYGMVDLPGGTMKTREGTVVDADDLMDEVHEEAEQSAAERGEIAGLEAPEQQEVIRKISLAALKFFIIKVDAKRRMTFNPAESVDMQGQTGPYIQNAYVRIRSILRKAKEGPALEWASCELADTEAGLLVEIYDFRQHIVIATEQYNPAQIANYCYQLAKSFHRYYHEYRILNAETEIARVFRLALITEVGRVLKAGLDLLGIEMPERM